MFLPVDTVHQDAVMLCATGSSEQERYARTPLLQLICRSSCPLVLAVPRALSLLITHAVNFVITLVLSIPLILTVPFVLIPVLVFHLPQTHDKLIVVVTVTVS